MKKLIFTVGLPGSGKTTWAHAQVAADPENTTIVCMDDLRNMMGHRLDGQEPSPKLLKRRETYVKEVRNTLLISAFEQGYTTVICADTNLVHKKRDEIVNIVRENLNIRQVFGFDTVVTSFLNVPIDECIRRDLKRPNSVGEKVIRRMYNNHVAKLDQSANWVVQDTTKPRAVLCDIDGTIAKMDGRGAYDWDKVHTDLPIRHVIERIEAHQRQGDIIVFMSGRDSACRQITWDWIKANVEMEASMIYLYMRPEGDTRKDSIVKEELFRQHVLPDLNVIAVYDDRPQVCRMWHSLGLPLFKVGDPDHEF
jgi:predicted kinase